MYHKIEQFSILKYAFIILFTSNARFNLFTALFSLTSAGNNVRAAKSNFTSSCVLLRMQKAKKSNFVINFEFCRCSNSSIEQKYLINFPSHTPNIFFTSTSNKYRKKKSKNMSWWTIVIFFPFSYNINSAGFCVSVFEQKIMETKKYSMRS